MGFSRQEYWRGVPLPSPTQLLVSNKNNEKFHKLISAENKGTFQLKCGKDAFENIHVSNSFIFNPGENDIQWSAQFTEFWQMYTSM